MREWKPSRKGVIKYNGEEYKIHVDKISMLRVMTSCIQPIEEMQREVMEIQDKFVAGELEMETYLTEANGLIDKIQQKFNMLCSVTLSYNNYKKILESAGELSFGDLEELTQMIVAEITGVNDERNAEMKERLGKYV